MSLTFPLSLGDFFSGLKIKIVSFDLSESLVSNETGGGEILRSNVGPRLWEGVVSIVPAKHRDQAAIVAKINTLRQAGREFYIYDPTLAAPRYDPDGAMLGVATPTVSAVSADNRNLSIDGLPVGYEISAGDMVSFTYGGRNGLHQFVSGGVADVTGATPPMEVSSHIRPIVPVGKAVRFINPICRAVLVPGSVKTGMKSGLHTDGISFSWRQTLRG